MEIEDWIWKFYRVYFIFFDGLYYKKWEFPYLISNASKHFSKSFIFGYIFQFGLYVVESNFSSPEGGKKHFTLIVYVCLPCHDGNLERFLLRTCLSSVSFVKNYSDVIDATLELWRIVGLEIDWIWKFYRVYFIFFDGLYYKKL